MPGNSKAIRARIRSVDSTRHITKAMELVASSKIRKAAARMEKSRFYRNVMLDAFADLSAEKSVYAKQRARELPALYIVIAGDRGMAGGYNNNIFRFVTASLPKDAVIFPIGKKTAEYFRRSGWECAIDSVIPVGDLTVGSCFTLSRMICDWYLEGRFSSVTIAYTELVSLLTQTPRTAELLPIVFTGPETGEKHRSRFLYEGGDVHVFNNIVPEYMAGVLYCAVKEGFASEQAARRTAMDAASKNADEMISKLNLDYNRARQAAITQEITEIVAGSEH